jgi:penicillin-binding protein 1C
VKVFENWSKLVAFFKTTWHKKWIKYPFVALIALFCVPIPSDPYGYSKALYSAEGELLSAMVSPQQQWRFSAYDTIPQNLVDAVRLFEDEYFYLHPGVNPVSIFNALIQNVQAGSIVRGASTIPMQVMRMRRPSSSRSPWNKLYESLAAIKYSLTRSKRNVMYDWLATAPFGGNTIGVHAAALRYFGRDIDELSWAEYALLAVMPNSPSKANLIKGQRSLIEKRNFLLSKLAQMGYIPADDLAIYQSESLPQFIHKLPQHGYHLLTYLSKEHPGLTIYKTTIPFQTQTRIEELVAMESSIYQREDINNMAVVVIDVESNSLKTYIGNTKGKNGFSYVDIAQAPRSYGSLLKPLLYTYALEHGHILPNQLIEDIPTAIGDFQPVNFDEKYRGVVPVEDIITQSLNVPAVRLLQKVGLEPFNNTLDKLHLRYLDKGSSYYGLSLILGGGESTLWDLCRMYKGFALNYKGEQNPYDPIKVLKDQPVNKVTSLSFDPAHLYATSEAMSAINRPREEKSWETFGSDHKVAWKTGTSFGHRDAWAIGFNGKYVVGVWVGNENGMSRHDLTGVVKAAPVMFKIFNSLPQNKWLPPPLLSSKRHSISVCKQTGFVASQSCAHKFLRKVSKASLSMPPCHYCRVIAIDSFGLRVPSSCAVPIKRLDSMMILPPLLEYFYMPSHIEYKPLPAISTLCNSESGNISIVYPRDDVKIFAPLTPEGKNSLIAQAHASASDKIYWYIDGSYVKTTDKNTSHNISLDLKPGRHTLYIVNEYGATDQVGFDVLDGKG